jgi:hypothetical protein
MHIGMGDRRALANLIAQGLLARFTLLGNPPREEDGYIDEFMLTQAIAEKVDEFFGAVNQ